MVFFDLDGVIRDLNMAVSGKHLHKWDGLIKGKTLTETVNNNLNLLFEAPPTEYYPLIKKIAREELFIISTQPQSWQPYTNKWLNKYLPNCNVIYTANSEHKFRYIRNTDLLIEDYPYFKDYHHVVLIERPYNKNVTQECYDRIKNISELGRFLHIQNLIDLNTRNKFK